MNRCKHTCRILIPCLALWIHAAPCFSQSPDQPTTIPVAPDTADNHTATLLFIHGRPQADLPVPIAELRGICVSRLEAGLRGRGHRTLDRAPIEDLVMKWRIRANHLIPPEFLTELQRDHQVGQVLVVTLLSDNARFLMTARLIDTGTGRLTYVELRDIDLLVPQGVGLDPLLMNWREALDRICLEIVPAWTPALRSAGKPILALPTRGIASDPQITSAAAHSLLKVLLGKGVSMLDPSLAEAAMLDAGLPSHWLDPRGRRLLQEKFGCEEVLVSELVSYDRNRTIPGSRIYDTDSAGPSRRSLTVFSMTMRRVDLATGIPNRSAQVMHELPDPTGWFGTPIRTTLLQELDTTSLELWMAYYLKAEDD